VKPTIYADEKETVMAEEIELGAEELEEVVAPGIGTSPGFQNHNYQHLWSFALKQLAKVAT
jgi:hypothetical protein